MSIHAHLSYEAAERLRIQKRNSTVVSVVIASMVLLLIAVVLGLVFLPSIVKTREEIVVICTPVTVAEPPTTPQTPESPTLNPAAPTISVTSVIDADAASSISVPTLDEAVTEVSDDFGVVSESFTTGDWNQHASGPPGTETAFGSSSVKSNALKGTLYDFKQSSKGKVVAYDQRDYADHVVRLQRRNFTEASMDRYFRAPTDLYLSHLAIANSPASKGPEFFGAKDTVRPSGWVVPYHGKIVAQKTGYYRFSGMGDDYLVVMLDGKTRLTACWPSTQDQVRGRWVASEPSGKFTSPYGVPLIFGDWVKLEAGKPVDITIAIGERPGGMVGFVLNIEEKGVEYRKASDGRPILPLFSIGQISADEQARIKKDFGSFEFDWENIPVFSTP